MSISWIFNVIDVFGKDWLGTFLNITDCTWSSDTVCSSFKINSHLNGLSNCYDYLSGCNIEAHTSTLQLHDCPTTLPDFSITSLVRTDHVHEFNG